MNKRVINGLLLVCIAGLLLSYFLTVTGLPEQLYTPEQQEYLKSNSLRSLSQAAPTMNYLPAIGGGQDNGAAALLPVEESRVRAQLQARYEEQEGVSVTVYDLEFDGCYSLDAPAETGAAVEVFFPFPGNLDTLHEVRFLVDGREPEEAGYSTEGIRWRTVLAPGETRRIEIHYQAGGANSFSYSLPQEQRTKIDVQVVVRGLAGSSIPNRSLPATAQASEEDGETFAWQYTGLIADRDIRLALPQRLSFAQRITRLQNDFQYLAGLAPLLVGLFTACLAGLFALRGLRPGLQGSLLAGLGLALFYPLLTFGSGIIGILPAALAALALVSALLLVFFGLSLGWKQTWRPLVTLLVVFPGFFSLGILTPWRGLMLTSGALLLVGTFMWAYARRPHRPESASPNGAAGGETASPAAPGEPPAPEVSHCPHCGRALEEDYAYCPGCGQDTASLQRCKNCGHRQPVPAGIRVYCLQCGDALG